MMGRAIVYMGEMWKLSVRNPYNFNIIMDLKETRYEGTG
jgi:hypothetical protein